MSRHPRESQLLSFALGELDASTSEAVAEHLSECERCERVVAAEKRLDELVLKTAPVLGEDSAERALAALWAQVDAEASAGDVPGLPTEAGVPEPGAAFEGSPQAKTLAKVTPLALWRRRVAAAVVLLAAGALVWWLAAHEVAPAAEPESQLAETEAPPAPAQGLLAPAVDLAELERVRLRVAEALSTAEAFGTDPNTFAAQAGEGLAALRQEGWPVDAHLRRLAQGADELLAARALCYVATTGSAPGVLAEALGRGRHEQDVLAWMAPEDPSLDNSPALLRELGRRAARGEARALELLLAESGGRRQRELRPLLEVALSRADAEPQLFEELARACPPDVSLAVLASAGEDPRAAQLFTELARSAPLSAAEALRPYVSGADADEPRLDWIVATKLDALVPELAAQLGDRHLRDAARSRLRAMGTDVALTALFVHHAEAGPGAAALEELAASLQAHPEQAAGLGRAVALTHAEVLLQLAELLDPPAADELLLGAFDAHEPGRDRHGRRAEWLVALGRLGSEQAGSALLARVDELPATDSVLALMWATAGRLAGSEAQQRWLAGGGDPRLLSRVADAAGERFDAHRTPSSSLLRPLALALHRNPRLR